MRLSSHGLRSLKNRYSKGMDAYILSLLAQSTGAILADQAFVMERSLSATLEDFDVILTLEFGTMATSDGERHKVYLESDATSIELYTRVGPERDQLLIYGRKGCRFCLTGGELAEAVIGDDL
jgi:hypothetical protein